nr:hypothetical protein [Janthinobacterium sp. Marseille]
MKKIIMLLSFFASTAHAQQAMWATDYSLSGYQIAKITNSSGAAAGYVCNLSNEVCDAYLATDVTCEENEIYPFMINSPLGSFPMTGKCVTIGTSQVIAMIEQNSAVAAYQSGGEIGFALPMANGDFQVYRFQTVGATAAIEAVRTRPTAKPPKQKNNRDNERI